ncbi:MAG: hypothetical protein LKJ47_05860 [Bifidobacteriaceae bacterium]|jgi:putative membrane protein|nr:hypothetical protein [Bifidobacteriaceae bacterium]
MNSKIRTAGIASLASIALLLTGGSLAYGATATSTSATAAGTGTAASQITTSSDGSVKTAVANSTAAGSGSAKATKDQNIYGILNSDGGSKNVYVVNQFKVTKAGTLVDYGDYDSAQNLSTTTKLTSSADKHSIDVSKGDFYYQGNLTSSAAQAQLPWNVGISYQLDGNTVDAKKLVGATGHVKVSIDTAKNPSAASSLYYKKYMLQISLTVPADAVNNLDAGDSGIVADAGANKQITFMVMPGKDGKLSFSADATDFSMSAISIAAAPFSIDIGDAFDTSSLTSGMEKLASGMNELSDGSGTLAANTGSLTSGTSQLASGAGTLASGVSQYSAGVAKFGIGVGKAADGATTLASGATSLSSGVTQYASGVTQLAKGTSSLSSGVSQLSGGVSQLSGGVSSLSTGVSKAAAGSKTYADQLSQQATSLGQKANATTIAAASEKYQTAFTEYSTALSMLAATQPMKLLTVQTIQKKLPDPVKDPSGYRSGLVSAINSQSDKDVTNILQKVLAITDTQAALTTLAGTAGSAQALSGAASGASKLNDGMQQLATGASTLATGASKTAEGASKTAAGAKSLDDGAQKAAKGGKTVASGASSLAKGATTYAKGLESLNTGASSLTTGASKLSSGAGTLATGASSLSSGVSQFASGVTQLSDGMATMAENTDKIPSTMKKEINKAMEAFTGTVTPVDFVSSKNSDVEQVQFMLTTSALEKTETTKAAKDAPTPSFWERLKNLFK